MDNSSKGMRWLNQFKNKLLAKKVDFYQEEIQNKNLHSFVSFTIVGTFISFSILVIGLLLSKISKFNSQFLGIFCFFICLHLFAKFGLHRFVKYITPIYYATLTPLMTMGILMGTYLDTGVQSVTIMVFICILPLFVLDKPWRIILYITCVVTIYIICCYDAKEYEIFLMDLIDLFIFYCFALGVNFFILCERIDSVENHVKFKNKAEIDFMTGIYNREAGLLKIKQLMYKRVMGAFIIVDIDNFKEINDNYGHMYGDAVIKGVSQVIKKAFQEEDIVLRMGGDEFVIYSVDLVDKAACEKNLEHLLNCLNFAKIGKTKGVPVSISVGCSINDKEQIDFNRLYRDSDKSLYEAKKKGKGCFVISA